MSSIPPGGKVPEILTESFCERCGTRYTFESATPRAKPLRGLKVLGRGLRNFVLSDDTSMDEAMAAARSEAERNVTTQQLDAFHSTFNFCMSCRQYTCANCWNEPEGQCLTCSPQLGREFMPAPFPTLEASLHDAAGHGNGVLDPAAGEAPPAWPLMDSAAAASDIEPIEEFDLGARLQTLDMGPVVTEEAVTAEPVTAEPVAADGLPPEGVDRDEPTDRPRSPVAGLEPDQSLDDVLEAFERQREEVAAAAQADAPAAEPEPHPESAAPEPAPEPPAQTVPEPVQPERVAAEAEPEPVAPVPAGDRIEQPVWLSVAPDTETQPAADRPDEPGLAAAATNEPEPRWPSQPQWPSNRAATPRPDTILGRPTVPSGGIDALWAASSRDVLAPPLASAPGPSGQPVPLAAQPCVKCGLSLSASARFCRRCGTAQIPA